MSGIVYKLNDVFVVGSQPTITYNPRPSLGLDDKVREYLDECGRILCITGPTKSGKTVLIRKVVHNCVRISGGEIETIDDFWSDLIDGLDAYTVETYEENVGHEFSSATEATGSIKPGGIGAEVAGQKGSSESSSQRHTQTRQRSTRSVAKAELLRSKAPVVVDDFHHIPVNVQRQIVHGVKDLVFDRVPFVFVSVPHHSADVVRAEKEMKGRVEQLVVTTWTEDELGEIGTKGFAALNIAMPEEMSARMAKESYGSPHLMQDFCLQICKTNNLKESLPEPALMGGEAHDGFFRKIAEGDELDATYTRLAQGPRPRADRIPRRMKNGETKDIYGALLLAIAETGPKAELDWVDIRGALRRIMTDEPPKQQECTRVLEQMSSIAKKLVWDDNDKRFVGDPVLDFDPELGKVHVTDPFFAFQLRWRIRGNGSSAVRR